MKVNKAYFCRAQTKWVRRPALLEMHSQDDIVAVGIWPEIAATERRGDRPALVMLTAQEAMAVAAWLSDAAERMRAKAAKAVARKAAREAKRRATRDP